MAEISPGRRDALGYRGKIGAIVPTTNTIVQPEFDDMRPDGVTNHIARIEPSSRGVPKGDFEEYARRLERGADVILKGINDIVPCEPDSIILAHSVHTFRGGPEGARSLQNTLEQGAGGIPVVLASLAFLDALTALGTGKRIAALTPFWPPGDKQVRSFFEEAGYEITALRGLQCPGPISIAAVTADEIIAELKDLARTGPDAIIQPGTNMASARIAASATDWLGIPVLSCNATLYWKALRSLGIEEYRQGFGPLLARY